MRCSTRHGLTGEAMRVAPEQVQAFLLGICRRQQEEKRLNRQQRPPAGQGSGTMKEQAARQQGAALQKGAATEARQEKKAAQAAASAKYREDGVPQQELERFARFLLPKIPGTVFTSRKRDNGLFEEWKKKQRGDRDSRGICEFLPNKYS